MPGLLRWCRISSIHSMILLLPCRAQTRFSLSTSHQRETFRGTHGCLGYLRTPFWTWKQGNLGACFRIGTSSFPHVTPLENLLVLGFLPKNPRAHLLPSSNEPFDRMGRSAPRSWVMSTLRCCSVRGPPLSSMLCSALATSPTRLAVDLRESKFGRIREKWNARLSICCCGFRA